MRRVFISLTIALTLALVALLPVRSQWYTGPDHWVMLLCKFSDTAAEPHPVSYFEALMSPVDGIGHWWNTVSYGSTFSPQIIGWLTVPNAKAHYTAMAIQPMRDALYQDCAAQAAHLLPADTRGVIVVAAEPMAAGFAGAREDSVPGAVAWLSPPEYTVPMRAIHHILAAMGVRFSLIDSIARDPNPWDGSSGSLALCSPRTDCYPPHPAAYAKLLALRVNPDQQLATHSSADPATYDIAYLDAPAGLQLHMVAVPYSETNLLEYYLVEARRNTGSNYDQILPGSGVLIHRISETAPRYQAWLVGANDVSSALDSAVIWTPGETFTDATNGIQISVLSQTASGYQIRVTRSQSVPPAPTATVAPTAEPTATATPAPTNLVTNPSFEGFDIAGKPWGWHYRGSDNSRVVCGVASEGVCALQMRREGQLHTFFATNRLLPGQQLSFGADIYNFSPDGNIQLALIVKYADPNLPKDQLILVPAGSYRQFRRYGGTLTLVGAPSSVQLAIRTAGLTGRVYIDNVYLRRTVPQPPN